MQVVRWIAVALDFDPAPGVAGQAGQIPVIDQAKAGCVAAVAASAERFVGDRKQLAELLAEPVEALPKLGAVRSADGATSCGMPTVITENDESPWDDQTGIAYHFPKRYLGILEPRHAGDLLQGEASGQKIRRPAHVPGPALLRQGTSWGCDCGSKSGGKYFYVAIHDFQEFQEPVPNRDDAGNTAVA